MITRTDKVNLQVNINGDVARNELNQLKKRAGELAYEMKHNLTRGTKEYIAASRELESTNARMTELKNSIGLTALSLKELRAEQRKLKAVFDSAVPDSAEYKRYADQLKAVNARIYEVRHNVSGLGVVFSKVKAEVKQFGTLMMGYLGFQFVTSQFKNIIQGAGKLSDSLGNIRRITGLTTEEVNKLNSSLSRIDTRTGMQALREIVMVAGRLGVAKENLADFTEAVDKLVVSLGDELGDADQIASQLGKILNVFEGEIQGESITKLGNAFVALAHTGPATGKFIADFDQRLSGIAKSAGISLGALSGLGAGLEELGARVESSSTAVQKLIIRINSDVPKAAKIAGESLEEFRVLLAMDPTEALLRYSEGLVKNKESFDEVVASMKDAGENGQRVIETIAKLGESSDYLRGRIELGKKSIQETNEITQSFNEMNETLGATLDKLSKEFYKLIYESGFTSWLTGAVEGTLTFVKALRAFPAPLAKIVVSIGALIVGIALYRSNLVASARASLTAAAATLKHNIVLNAQAIALLATRVSQDLYTRSIAASRIVVELLTGRIRLAAAAQMFWNTVMRGSAGPLSVVATALALAGAAAYALSKAFRESAKEATFHAETIKLANKEIGEQKSEIDTLTKVVKDNTISLETRREALQKLIDMSPEYLSRLTMENIATQEGKDILDRYNKALETNANLKAAAAIKDREFQKSVQLRATRQELEIAQKSGLGFADLSEEGQEAFGQFKTSTGRMRWTANLLNLVPSASDFREAIKGIQDEIDQQNDRVNASADNYLAKTKEKEEVRRQFLMAELMAARDLQRSLEKGTEEYDKATERLAEAQRNYMKEFGSGGGWKAAIENAEEAIGLIKKLQDRIRQLDEDRPNLMSEDAIAKNIEERKKLQAELDRLEGRGSKKETKNTEYERLKKEAAAFQAEIARMRQDMELGEMKADEAELKRIELKYSELLRKAADYYKKQLISEKDYEDARKILSELQVKEATGVVGERDYQASLEASDKYFDELRRQAAEAHGNGEIDSENYNKRLEEIERESIENRIRINESYQGYVKAADRNLITEKKRLYDFDLKNFIKTEEDKAKAAEEAAKKAEARTQAEIMARAKLAVSSARPGSGAQLAAKKALLDLETQLKAEQLKKEYDLSEEAWREGNALYDQLMAERREKEQELESEHWMRITDAIIQGLSMAADAMHNLNQIIANRENRELQRDRKLNEEKKKNLKSQLDNKLMSRQQYEKKIEQLEEQQAKKEAEARRRQAEREKSAAMFSAVINTASAVIKTYLEMGGFPLGIPFAAAMAAIGAMQIGAIASTPLPEAERGNWFRTGDKHSDPSGGIPVMIERDEAVVRARAMTDSNTYTVTGTPAQITSKLNSMHGGVNWASGAHLEYPKFREMGPRINPNLPRIMAEGGMGKVRQMSSSPAEKYDEDNRVIELLEKMLHAQEKQQSRRSYVVLKDFEEQNGRYNAAKRASGL